MIKISLLALAFLPLSLQAKPKIPEAPTPIISIGGTEELSEDGEGFKAPETEIKGRSITYQGGGRWQNPKAINVCFVNPEQGPVLIEDFKAKLTQEYAKAGIGFNFQGKCQGMNAPQQIRMYLRPEHACNPQPRSAGGGVSYLGPVNGQLGGADGPGTMAIRVCRDRNDWPAGRPAWFVDYTLSTVVHEFGHALGLAHEQERNDAPICNDQRGTLPNGGQYRFVTAYDRFSVMNYCKDPANNNSLSAGDIIGLNSLYPNNGGGTTPPPTNPPPTNPPPAGGGNQPAGSYQIRSVYNGQCIDVPSNGNANGLKLQIYACNKTVAQAFYARPGAPGEHMFQGAGSNKFVDVPGSSLADGALMQIWDWNSSPAQKFRLVDKGAGNLQIVNVNSGKCLDLDVGSGRIVQWVCNPAGQRNQLWNFFAPNAESPSVKL